MCRGDLGSDLGRTDPLPRGSGGRYRCEHAGARTTCAGASPGLQSSEILVSCDRNTGNRDREIRQEGGSSHPDRNAFGQHPPESLSTRRSEGTLGGLSSHSSDGGSKRRRNMTQIEATTIVEGPGAQEEQALLRETE